MEIAQLPATTMDHTAGADRPVNAAAVAEEKELTDAPPDVRLLVKRRQMFEVQEALEAQKQQYAAQVECTVHLLSTSYPSNSASCSIQMYQFTVAAGERPAGKGGGASEARLCFTGVSAALLEVPAGSTAAWITA